MFAFYLLLVLAMLFLGIGLNAILLGNYLAAQPMLSLSLLFVVLAIAIGLIGLLKRKG